jgi:argininosuccinate lyase
MKLWGGRFEAGSSEVFERFSGSLHFDKKLVDVDIRGSQAFAKALERVGILTADERQQLVAAFEELRTEAATSAFYEGATDEDVHTLVIRKLKDKVAGLADKIHTGRSRNEQVSLDVRLWLREAIDETQAQLAGLMAALLELARKYPDAVIPGYTHLRRAQAVLWPHYLLAYFEMFMRDYERMSEARSRVNVMPLGSGALAGSGFPHDREAIARDLGFAAVTRNSMDVSADRDFALDYLHAANLVMLHLSRLSEDWILYSSEEFGWMELGDGVTSGSSLMPQKKNPDSLELIRGKSGRVFGDYSSLFVTVKGLPLTYNRDLQEDKEPLFDSVAQLELVLPAMAGLVATLHFDVERMAALAPAGYTLATDIAEWLVRRGVPFRVAHETAGAAVRAAEARGVGLEDLTDDDLAQIAGELTPDVREVLTVTGSVASRNARGGTAPEQVVRQLERIRDNAARLRTRLGV